MTFEKDLRKLADNKDESISYNYYAIIEAKNKNCLDKQEVKDALEKLTHTNTSDIEGLIEAKKLKKALFGDEK